MKLVTDVAVVVWKGYKSLIFHCQQDLVIQMRQTLWLIKSCIYNEVGECTGITFTKRYHSFTRPAAGTENSCHGLPVKDRDIIY